VTHAAVKVRGRIFTGGSHREAVVATSLALGVDPPSIWSGLHAEDQGFVTDRGQWLSRAEAWTLAKKRGQLRWDSSLPGIRPELHSEELR
jgi:hypothetical protein